MIKKLQVARCMSHAALTCNLQRTTCNFTSPRIHTRHTHGTGCALASAIATGIAQGMGLEDAVARAHSYVQAAIRNAPGLGAGHGPLGHNIANLPE